MAFLLDKLKRKSGTEDEEDEDKGFDDLNYMVGNTSGMDVTQQIPSELAERVGRLAQRGGGEMEVQVVNPSTFHIDREDLLNVVNGLGIDISIHSDPNVGYTSPYQVGEGGGYDGTHNYFTQYLEAFTSFKQEAENREDLNFGDGEDEIRIGRINPHISVSPLPQTEQERAQGVGLDPLGYVLTDVQENELNVRRKEGKNIYDNLNFLRKFYRMFIVDQFEENEYQLFERIYSPYSNKFNKKWNRLQNEKLNQIYEQRAGSFTNSRLDDKVKLIRLSSQADPAVTDFWKDVIEEEFEPVEVEVVSGEQDFRGPKEISSLKDLEKIIIDPNIRITRLRRLPEIYHYLKKREMEELQGSRLKRQGAIEKIKNQDELWERIQKPLEEAIDELWHSKYEDNLEDIDEEEFEQDPRISLVPVSAKTQAVAQHYEIPQRKILEKSFKASVNGETEIEIRQEVENLFGGEEDYFRNGDDRDPETRHEDFLRSVIDQVERQMWEESGIFYRIAPAWISSSDYGIGDSKETNHEGWIAPKFLWKYLVERKYGDKYDIDLKDPRKENGYFEALESDREFQMDVAAAVAGTYMWSMFTQKEKDMQTESQQNPRRCTWIDWMNDHGIGVNMESMAGDPRQFFKLWRPVHAVAACRAVNITARRKAREEGLGERGDLHPKLDDCPVKFTIDMEHVSSFGVNPLKEMEILKEKEKDLLENPVSIDGTTVQTPGDSEKPLAKMVRMYHLTKPGHETTSGVGHTHGPFRKGNTELYRWLYKLVEWGFGRTGEDGERASVMYEVGGEKAGTVYQAKLSMDMIQIGIDPEKDLDPSQVDPTKDQFDSREEALLARFFSMDKSQYSSEWAKIEEHAFDPLQGLLEAEEFDYTYSSKASLENDNQPRDWIGEEYK